MSKNLQSKGSGRADESHTSLSGGKCQTKRMKNTRKLKERAQYCLAQESKVNVEDKMVVRTEDNGDWEWKTERKMNREMVKWDPGKHRKYEE